jgi:nitronate monooxygenase
MTWNRNRLTEKLGIDYPIIQGPLGGLSSQRLTAAVSNFGGLGSFGALTLSPEEIKNVISQIRSMTSKPFAVNLFGSLGQSTFPHTRNPFAYVGRAVSKFNSVGLRNGAP